jgi:glycosyltransferase involved in cell wall biosynthesis
MTGYVPEEEASRLLSGADVGALPFNEGVTLKSGTLLTMLTHGLPVIATRPDPPEPDLADGRLLRLVERRDVPGLAATLLDLLSSPSQRARLGEAGRAYTRSLSWRAMTERHAEVYEEALQSGRVISGTDSAK